MFFSACITGKNAFLLLNTVGVHSKQGCTQPGLKLWEEGFTLTYLKDYLVKKYKKQQDKSLNVQHV